MRHRLLHALHPEPRREQLRAQVGYGRVEGVVADNGAIEAVAEVEQAIAEPPETKNAWS